MGGIKKWKKVNQLTLDPPGDAKPMDHEQGLSKTKKKKKAAKKLKDFWEKKKQKQKNLSPKASDVSLKDAAMKLPTRTQQARGTTSNKSNEVLSPRTAPETVDSQMLQLPVLPNSNYNEQKTTDQIFRRQKEAPGKKGLEIMEVVVPANNAGSGNISPISIDRSTFYPQFQQKQQKQQLKIQSHFYTEGEGIEVGELAQALQLPSLARQNRGRGGGGILDDLASETTESTRGHGSRERAHTVGARIGRRRIRSGRIRDDQVDPTIFSTAIDLTDIENEEQAMKLALNMDDPSNVFDNISNPLTAVPDVFGSLTDLLKDPPADGEDDDRSEGIGSFKPGSSKEGVDARDDLTKRGTVDVMKQETTKGAPFDPIDLTDCDYRLFVRKPAQAINIGFVENADDAYDEMIEKSDNLVTKATHRMLGRNNTWYLG